MDKQKDKPAVKVVTEDCTVYCSICNKTIELKAGEPIPVCCGKTMINIDA
jgi:hypothetical protein